MFLHQLISSSPLVELGLYCIQLQDERDWSFIVESMDLSLLEILDTGSVSTGQLFLSTHASDLFFFEDGSSSQRYKVCQGSPARSPSGHRPFVGEEAFEPPETLALLYNSGSVY